MGDDPLPENAVAPCAVDWIGAVIACWQTTGDPARLEVLVAAVRQVVEAVAGQTLARCHVCDRSAVDDVVSLVLEHLSRLPRDGTGERRVAAFRADEPAVGRGLAYIRILARNRAIDVVRSRRRRERRGPVFSELDGAGRDAVEAEVAAGDTTADRHERLRDAVARLEPTLREVVELLLDGKTQAVIAHMLDVCEGTVSRMRKRAVDQLRDLLAD